MGGAQRYPSFHGNKLMGIAALHPSYGMRLVHKIMLLMIDNYDSFTSTLVQYFAELGEDVVVHRNDEVTVEQIARLNPQHIVISPGPCTTNEAGGSVAAIRAFAGKMPLLGVSRRR